MRMLRDGEVRQVTFGRKAGVTWVPWVKHQENAILFRLGRRTWRFGFKYTNGS